MASEAQALAISRTLDLPGGLERERHTLANHCADITSGHQNLDATTHPGGFQVKSLFSLLAWLLFGVLAWAFGWKDDDHDKGL